MIGIVDYNAGNIKSVERALIEIKAEYKISQSPLDLENCEKIIFPGVGEAKYAMEQLKKTGFDSFLRDFYSQKKQILGICLGSQIIFEHSQEGDVACLGLLKGTIKSFQTVWQENGESPNLKVPQIGWNDLTYSNGSSKLLKGIPEHCDFYFVHSYLIQPEDKSIVKAFANYGTQVPACIEKDNLYAFQCHPEKSGKWGLKVLQNFINS
ncbi:imidazole glycerol phosphate synthase subunit HisH [Treponema pectinovorum]|uniref:imidazole glycerol phosphate synthase subunit HisH n=1 Tax=Treponema pectinovorum TaxID=164 RepID=UPI0011F232B3|nr:imidazole glycerol phosphate synthase subunit HisH [Treponema pectinovorum]